MRAHILSLRRIPDCALRHSDVGVIKSQDKRKMRLSKNVSSRAHLKSKYCCINTSAWYLSGRIYYQMYGDDSTGSNDIDIIGKLLEREASEAQQFDQLVR